MGWGNVFLVTRVKLGRIKDPRRLLQPWTHLQVEEKVGEDENARDTKRAHETNVAREVVGVEKVFGVDIFFSTGRGSSKFYVNHIRTFALGRSNRRHLMHPQTR
jgi:hypothetical protein